MGSSQFRIRSPAVCKCEAETSHNNKSYDKDGPRGELDSPPLVSPHGFDLRSDVGSNSGSRSDRGQFQDCSGAHLAFGAPWDRANFDFGPPLFANMKQKRPKIRRPHSTVVRVGTWFMPLFSSMNPLYNTTLFQSREAVSVEIWPFSCGGTMVCQCGTIGVPSGHHRSTTASWLHWSTLGALGAPSWVCRLLMLLLGLNSLAL